MPASLPRLKAAALSLTRIGFAVLALSTAGLWAGVRWLERHRLYDPSRVLTVIPRSLGMEFEDVTLAAADGVKIHGWFIPAAAPSSQGLTTLFCHGNAGNISNRVEKAAVLHKLGLSVFLFDYRGYGRSAGSPSEHGTYLDADAAYRYLTQTRKIAPERLVIHGESIGSGVAVEAALRHPSRALIVESGFTSIAGMGETAAPFLPLRWFVSYRYDNLEKLPKVGRPVLVMHSRGDEIIPFEMGEALFKAAAPPKRFLAMKGSHDDGYLDSGRAYADAIRAFLDEL